jgi:O-antigen biosynthesis protein
MPDFNPLQYPIAVSELRYFSGDSAWTGHIPFALVLVQLARPRTIVELGTHWGDSYCAFCQAVAELKLPTRCTAIDTWQGDAHTRPYNEQVYQRLKRFHDPAYSTFSTLMRTTFDQACPQFADNSIDLLHIDGLHTYEAVRHDFEMWKPKLSERGIVLLHDTAATHDDFGVWRLWQNLEKAHPSFQFMHESGLGILAIGKEAPPDVVKFLEIARREEAAVRQYFAAVGGRWTALTALMRVSMTLQQARTAVNDWRGRSGRPKQEIIEAPYQLAGGTLADVRELLDALKR